MARRQKPAIAAWIQRERKRLGLSTKELSERLSLIGAKVGEQTISVWESYADRRPSPDNIDALERLFGSQAPEKATTTDEVAAAIDRQTAALTAFVQELRAAREQDEVRLRTLEAAVALLAREGDVELPDPIAPRA